MSSADPIRAFIETAIERNDKEGDEYSRNNENMFQKSEVYESYKNYCTANKLTIETSETFSRRMKGHGFKDKQITMQGIRAYFWLGIKLKDWKLAEEGQIIL